MIRSAAAKLIHFMVFGYIVAIQLGHRVKNGVHSVSLTVSWGRQEVQR